jgi:murein DD-endopeptidase MepM/ murein hydrolase activator NlpD
MTDAPLAKERSPNWRRPDERAGKWHGRGEKFRELWDAEWEYEPPQWAKERAQTAAKETGRVVQRTTRKRLQKVSDAILSLDTLELLTACLLLGGVNIYVALAGQFSFLPMGEYAPTRQNLGFTDGIYFKKLTKEDKVAGYEITSNFGYRNAPTEGASTFHKGVDVGTPWGTPIHMVGNGSVNCGEEVGYGKYAILKPNDLPYEFLAGHLSHCVAGNYRSGQAVASSGNSGLGTGDHLHWEQHQAGEAIAPTEGYLWWTLNGSQPKPHGGNRAKTGWGAIEQFSEAIVRQESGGNIDAVNEIGAMGLFQFMPDTLAEVAPKCIGKVPTQAEFLADAGMQEAIAGCYWSSIIPQIEAQTADLAQQCRMLASYHYSGDINLWNNTTPQRTNEGEYPSIAQYTEEICDKSRVV